MNVARGDVVLVYFPFSSGEGGKVRPAVVVQSDRNNARLHNTIVAMVTSTTHRTANEPTQFLVDPATPDGATSGLLNLSAVSCENLLTIKQSRLMRVIGQLSPRHVQQLDAALRVTLEL